MTREEAIEAIKCNWPDSRYTILREALDMAISALRQQEHFRGITKMIEPLTLDELRMALAAACKERDEARKELHEAKNELCFKCGNYREAHNGACDGCRWKKA